MVVKEKNYQLKPEGNDTLASVHEESEKQQLTSLHFSGYYRALDGTQQYIMITFLLSHHQII